MDALKPPPLIDSCRVLHYAIVDSDVRFTRCSVLYVDDVELGAVPRLAVCKNLIDDSILLLHCDEKWSSLGSSGSGDVESVIVQANRLYDGLASKWVKSPYSELDVAKFFADSYADQRCSFCGRYHIELDGTPIVEGTNAAICGECIERLHGELCNLHMDEDEASNLNP
jgi:hypothetical protein